MNRTNVRGDSGPDASIHASKRGSSTEVRHTRGISLFIVLLLLLAASLFFPWLSWQASPELELKMAVVDKTVPFEDRREHRGLFWLFGQNKFVDPATDEASRFYDFRDDYVGYDPQYAPRDLQPDEQPEYDATFLNYGELADRNILYLADTYGVYRADYHQFNEEFAHTRHSPMIFGGMTEEEVTAMEQFAAEGRDKLIIAEFNTFASPTPSDLAKRMEAVLGVDWTRWIGRYFVDFSRVEDVPEWLYEKYDGSEEWERRGRVNLIDEKDSAFVLVHDESPDFIFLWKNEDIEGDHALYFEPLEQYADGDMMQGVKSGPVNYWIELLHPGDETEVLSEYRFSLTQTGMDKMAELELDLVWPAITRYQPSRVFEPAPTEAAVEEGGGSEMAESVQPEEAPMPYTGPKQGHTAYYLVGDMSDFDKAMGSPHTRLTLFINRSYYGKNAKIGSQEFMFWNGYYPFLCNVLRAKSNELNGQPENVFLFK